MSLQALRQVVLGALRGLTRSGLRCCRALGEKTASLVHAERRRASIAPLLTPKRRLSLLSTLAFKDIAHERMMSLCLVIALAGLIAPLLVLFGLKYGVIHELQSELIQDPVNRELKPAETQLYTEEFFTRVKSMPEVSFLVESVTQGASVIRATSATGLSKLGDMLPTDLGDPLLVENGTRIPTADEVVLSERMAQALEVAVGDAVTLGAQRIENGDIVHAQSEFTVAGILPLRGDVLDRVYVPAVFARDVESFREGFAVGSRQWKGRDRGVRPAFHSIIFALARKLSASEQSRLSVNTDFFLLEELSGAEFQRKLGVAPPTDLDHLYELAVIDKPASEKSLTRVKNRLQNIDARYWAWNTPIEIEIKRDGGEWLSGMLHTDGRIDSSSGKLPGDNQSNTGATSTGSTKPATSQGIRESQLIVLGTSQRTFANLLMLNAAEPDQQGDAALRVTFPGTQVTFPVTVQAIPDSQQSAASNAAVQLEFRAAASLLGQLSRARQSRISYDQTSGQFELDALGARGFRLFTTSIYNVADVRDSLLEMEVPTLSAIQVITRLQALDKGLSSLFFLIALAGVATSIIVMIANQISSVQRKRDALAQVRLLGLSKGDVSVLPLLTGSYLSISGAVAGILIALFTAWVINRFFATSLGFDGAVCVIKASHAVFCLVCVFVLTAVSSLFAAASTLRVDPAEGMRYE